eukprot:gb/GEZN01013446.1/.p1 GENE.gb/GEZN01013446.1/~~gb/GEZN01013446.1/.p1  ORF type:complete len:240 (-),score=39.38 gb/GEZN01013446.1/:260-979(-)
MSGADYALLGKGSSSTSTLRPVKAAAALVGALLLGAAGVFWGAIDYGAKATVNLFNKYAQHSNQDNQYELPQENLVAPLEWDLGVDTEGVEKSMVKTGPGPGQMLSFARGRVAASEAWKMVLIVNMNLGMGKGKMAAQCAHAAVDIVLSFPGDIKPWIKQGQAKVVLKGTDEEQLRDLAREHWAGVVGRAHTIFASCPSSKPSGSEYDFEGPSAVLKLKEGWFVEAAFRSNTRRWQDAD